MLGPSDMRHRTENIALFALLLSGAFWLGGLNVRAAVGFDLLQVGTLEFKPNIHPYVERAVYSLLAQSSLILGTSYVICWISSVVYLTTCRLSLRQNGWLVVSAILFFVLTPVEIYTGILGPFNNQDVMARQTSFASNAPRSLAIWAWKTTWKRRSPSSSLSAAASPRSQASATS